MKFKTAFSALDKPFRKKILTNAGDKVELSAGEVKHLRTGITIENKEGQMPLVQLHESLVNNGITLAGGTYSPDKEIIIPLVNYGTFMATIHPGDEVGRVLVIGNKVSRKKK